MEHLPKRQPVAREGYYARNRIYESHVHMYEIADLRYPNNARIREVLGTLNRVVQDSEYFGWASVLLYGEADPGDTRIPASKPRRRE